MSDRDLRNLYENVRRGDEYHAPRRESELYRSILNEAEASVESETKCKRCHGSGREPQDGWDGLKRNKLVAKWMSDSGFVSPTVMMSIVGYLESSGCNWDLIKTFVESPKKQSLVKILNGMSPGKNGGLMAPIVDIIINNFQLEQDIATRLYYSLFNLPFAESTVSVGKGELIMALFTDAEKGNVGDIMVAGAKGMEEDEDGVVSKKDVGLQSSGYQIEVKVGKARVISARGGKFLEPNMDVERVFAARKRGEDITSTPYRTDKPGYQGIKKSEFDREQGQSQYYQTTDGQHLTNEEFVNHLFGDKRANPGFNAFDRKDKVCSNQMLSILNEQDPQAGINNVPNYKLRDLLISTSIVWSYANPSGTGHGFDFLLAILSSGVEGKSPEDAIKWNQKNLDSHGEFAKQTDDGTGLYWDPRMSEGDKDLGIAIPCKGSQGFNNIYKAITDGDLVVSRMSSTGRLDGEGMYMYYRGSDTNVGHESSVGVKLT